MSDGTPFLRVAADRIGAPDKDFVQKPSVSELTLSPLQALGIVAPELQAPPADCLVGYGDSSFGEQILDISEGDTESIVQPDCVANDCARVAVSVVA